MEDKSKKISLSDLGHDYFKDNTIVESEVYPLDCLLQGGLELGSMIQLAGAPAVGKSTIGMQIAHNVCNQGYNVLYLDSEGSVSQEMMNSVNLMKYYNSSFFLEKVSQFDKAEKVLDQFISTGEINFIIIDSLAALINPAFLNLNHKKSTYEKAGISVTTNDAHVTSGPLTKFMSKYRSAATDNKICFILINQYRMSFDSKFNSTTKVYGPKNILYSSDVLIRINACPAKGRFKDFNDFASGLDIGKALEFEVDRSNKCAPGVKAPAFLKYGEGIDNLFSYFYELKGKNIVIQSGVYYSLTFNGSEIKEKGALAFIDALRRSGFCARDFKKLISGNDSSKRYSSDADIEV